MSDEVQAKIAAVWHSMAYCMIPRYVRCVDAFPKTGTERTMKYQLRSPGVTRDIWDREAAGYTLKRQV